MSGVIVVFPEDLHEASKTNNQELESENGRLQGEPLVLTVSLTYTAIDAHVLF